MTDPAHVRFLQDTVISGDSPNPSSRQTTVHTVALSSDLMLTVRLEAISTAYASGFETVEALAGLLPALVRTPPDVVLLDLADKGFPIDATCTTIRDHAPEATIVAFYPHVRSELGAAATAAGCDVVMPRSRLLSNSEEALRAVFTARARREPASGNYGGAQ